ncbi:hypothetical protein JJV70_07690 [Streptomyces sp. JJ66]|uniref:DUF6480 family protein n=1 Tax=Streptomyces sp. JJ66 TaxID=2803843 RepID=UPI001C598D75|nr:DUF6480 family protein [Streptomyces sp. JJ66]MBW1601996.1 hypothetical protein [Streptomyces sp. JJ66]
MNDKNVLPPDPADREPKRSVGRPSGSGVPPGETPPAEGSTLDAGPEETYNPTTGWARGPLIVIALIVVVFVGYFVARLFAT